MVTNAQGGNSAPEPNQGPGRAAAERGPEAVPASATAPEPGPGAPGAFIASAADPRQGAAPEPAPESPGVFPAPAADLRRAAVSFGAEADRYDRARPTYPAAMVEAIIEAGPGPAVLDVGVGTGIAARLFAERGCAVLGVDVDERMAEVARRHGIAVETARFEEWDAKGREFDVVTAAQTWHWVDAVAGTAKAAEVLRPGGRFALCWNVFQPEPDAAAAFADVHRRLLPEFPDIWARPVLEAYEPMFAKAEHGIRGSGAFTEPERWRYEWERPYTTDAWLDGVPTSGGYSSLKPEQMERLLEGTRAAIDGLGGSFTMRYTTIVVTAARR